MKTKGNTMNTREQLVRLIASSIDDIDVMCNFDICVLCKVRVYEMRHEEGLRWCNKTFDSEHQFKMEAYGNKIDVA